MSKSKCPIAPVYEAGGFTDRARAVTVRVEATDDPLVPVVLLVLVGGRAQAARLSRSQAELIQRALGRAQDYRPHQDSSLPPPPAPVLPDAVLNTETVRINGRAYRVPVAVAHAAADGLKARAVAAAAAAAPAAPAAPAAKKGAA